jgi:hypothetical protein
VVRHGILHGRRSRTADEDTTQFEPVEDTRNDRVITQDDRGVTWPGTAPPGEAVTTEVRPARARVSLTATLGLIISVVAMCATLTGLLAPEGLVLGVLGFLFSVGGLVAASRPGVAGHTVATLGALIGLAAATLAGLAMTRDFAWPNSSTDYVSQWHDWLVAHWSWLSRW